MWNSNAFTVFLWALMWISGRAFILLKYLYYDETFLFCYWNKSVSRFLISLRFSLKIGLYVRNYIFCSIKSKLKKNDGLLSGFRCFYPYEKRYGIDKLIETSSNLTHYFTYDIQPRKHKPLAISFISAYLIQYSYTLHSLILISRPFKSYLILSSSIT